MDPLFPAFYCKSLLLDTPAVFASVETLSIDCRVLPIFFSGLLFFVQPLILVQSAIPRYRFEGNPRLDEVCGNPILHCIRKLRTELP